MTTESSHTPATSMPLGIVPVIETPFDERGGLDRESVVRLIDDAIAGGASGLVGPVVASEVHALSRQERAAHVGFCAKTINQRVPFIVGASSGNVEECRHFAALAEAVGARAYLVAVPDSLYGNSQAVVDFFRAVARGFITPLIIQDLQWSGPGLDIPTIRRLKEILPSLLGMKVETVPSGPKYTKVREAMGADFYIAGGWDVPQLIEALDRGVDAMVPECATVRVFTAIYRAHFAGRRDEALRLFRELLPVLVFSNQEIGHFIAFYKRMLVRKGILRHATMRAPGYSWDRFNLRIADELIEYYLDLELNLR